MTWKVYLAFFTLFLANVVESKPRPAAPPLIRPKADVEVRVSKGFLNSRYRYRVHNQSAKPVAFFSLILESSKIRQCRAPKGWQGKAVPLFGSSSVEWTAAGGAEIAAGQSLEGFEVTSPSRVGKADFVIRNVDLVESRNSTTGPADGIRDKIKEVADKPLDCKAAK